MVTIGMNGKMTTDEASKVLGCSYSHLVNLIHMKKLKGQKIEKKWILDSDDIYRAKNTRLVRPRMSLSKPIVSDTSAVVRDSSESVKIQLDIPKDRLEIIRLAFSGNNKTLQQHLSEHLESLYMQIKTKLADLTF